MNTTIEKTPVGKIKSFAPDSLPVRPKYPLPAEPHRVWERDGFSLSMGAIPEREDERPPDSIKRGSCPDCGGDLVANLYCHEQRGYLLRYECWEGILPGGVCDFYTVP